MSELTHINASGEANMVDVSAKAETVREARAEAFVHMAPETLELIVSGQHHKGDVFATARIAGIQAAKKTWPPTISSTNTKPSPGSEGSSLTQT